MPGKRLRDLRGDMHSFFSDAGVSALQKRRFSPDHPPEKVMTPRLAGRHLLRNNVDYLPIDAIEGRIATSLFVVYPPGIATIVSRRTARRPGASDDRLSQNVGARHNWFPGFEAEIQDLYREPDAGTIPFSTYLVCE